MRKSVCLLLIFVIMFPIQGSTVQRVSLPKNPDGKFYEVIVFGATPEGIAASVSASRNGLKTLLVDKNDKVGGLYTRAGLNTIDMNYGPNKEQLVRGIFGEFRDAVDGDSFDINKAEEVFNNMLASSGVYLMLNANIANPTVRDGELVGVDINGAYYTAKRFIDATEDADIAALCGVPYTYGQEDIGHPERVMAPTMIFKLEGVDWDEVRNYLNTDDSRDTGANNRSAWGYAEMYKYKPMDPDILVRGLNMGRQDDGSVLVNSLLIYNVNLTDDASKENAMEKAERELPYVIEYMHQLSGLENVSLAGVMDELYVRESRHIIGEYRLSLSDVLENRYFEDAVVLGSYPVDIQSFMPGHYGWVMGKPVVYSIPFRCLVPKQVDNLLVVGRSASFDSLASGSARVVPVGMGEGQAAGVAAKISIKKDMSFRQMAYDSNTIHELQKTLREQGAFIKDYKATPQIVKSPYYPYIKELLHYGYIQGGYSNDYRLDEVITYNGFIKILNPLLADHIKDYNWLPLETNDRPMTYGQAAHLLKNYGIDIGMKETDESMLYSDAYKVLYTVMKSFPTFLTYRTIQHSQLRRGRCAKEVNNSDIMV